MSEFREIEAPAKTNLWLNVLGKREDGFHEIETRMVPLSLADHLNVAWREDEQVSMTCSDSSLPTGEENLCIQAVRAMEKHHDKVFAVHIELEKKIPSGAGLGGGSSDAAAVLRAINDMAALEMSDDELAAVGATIGSDVPFFVYGRPCDCRGRGEIVEPIEESVGVHPLLLVKPAFEISASSAYQAFEKSAEYEGFNYSAQSSPFGEMVNDLERPVFEKFPILGEMKQWLLNQNEIKAALLSGSGSTMLALLKKDQVAEPLIADVRARYGENCWTCFCETR
ncbi:MAG: 4-(cytidine 5'-diphospho)-2-C-methyl-D-erythritol kinase [Verrucomicrobiota bacterium]